MTGICNGTPFVNSAVATLVRHNAKFRFLTVAHLCPDMDASPVEIVRFALYNPWSKQRLDLPPSAAVGASERDYLWLSVPAEKVNGCPATRLMNYVKGPNIRIAPILVSARVVNGLPRGVVSTQAPCRYVARNTNLTHYFDTAAGDSGSPIFWQDLDGNTGIAAVHIQGSKGAGSNLAVVVSNYDLDKSAWVIWTSGNARGAKSQA